MSVKDGERGIWGMGSRELLGLGGSYDGWLLGAGQENTR